VEENLGAAYPAGYRLGEEQFLRTQMTVTTFQAIKGRKPPVRLLAAGRVFRPCPKGEDPTHLRVFHQCDGICVEAGADLAALKATVERVLHGVLGPATMRWREHDFGFVESGLGADLKLRGRWVEVSGCGTLRPETLRKAGFDPSAVGGFAWGLGLERLAMLRFGIADIRSLWRPPYIQG
jgi:phenylalanyl-tRNA synthetase alpha chain